MNLILLNAMVEEARQGFKIDSSWMTREYTNIVMTLHEVGLLAIKKNHVQNCQKSIKGRWREVYDLFGGLSGFAWNHTTKHFETEDGVWNDLIKVPP